MGKPLFKQLFAADDGLDLNAAEATAAIDISHLESYAMMLGGTFVGTVDAELSFDGGTTWVPHPNFTGKTAPVVAGDGGIRAQLIRFNVTAYTSGTPKVFVSGTDTDLKG